MRRLLEFNNVRAMQVHQVLRQAALILIAVLMAKSGLPGTDIGHYEMLMYIGTATTFFWITGLIQGFLSCYPGYSPEERPGMMLGSYLLVAGVCLFLIVFMALEETRLIPLLTGNAALPWFHLFLVFLLLYQPTYLLEHYFLLKGEYRKIALLSLLSFLMQTAVVVVPIYLGFGLRGSFIGLIFFALFRHIWLWIYLLGNGFSGVDRGKLKDWLVISAPLVVYAFLGGFHQVFDNWLVGHHFHGDQFQFALFRYGARELPFALALAGAFSTALLPEVARDLPAALVQIRNRSRKLFHLLFPVSILLMLTSERWFPLVFSPEFAPSALVFNVFLLALISRLIFSRTVLMGLRDNRVILGISVLELLLNVGFSLLLVRFFGLAGIAGGTILAYLLNKAGLCAYLYFRHGIGVGAYTDLRWFLGYSFLLLLVFGFVA